MRTTVYFMRLSFANEVAANKNEIIGNITKL